jgi:hypothetical protein
MLAARFSTSPRAALRQATLIDSVRESGSQQVCAHGRPNDTGPAKLRLPSCGDCHAPKKASCRVVMILTGKQDGETATARHVITVRRAKRGNLFTFHRAVNEAPC